MFLIDKKQESDQNAFNRSASRDSIYLQNKKEQIISISSRQLAKAEIAKRILSNALKEGNVTPKPKTKKTIRKVVRRRRLTPSDTSSISANIK